MAIDRVTSDLTISADGYSAGLHQTQDRPFGDDGGDRWGRRVHAWMFDTPGENRAEVDRLNEAGAFIMGRNMFGPVRGAWDRPWNGWWGDDPPFHLPVLVLTHHPRPPLACRGGTTFTFVTDGLEEALAQAQAAADGRDVAIAGGAGVARQCIAAGVVDEIQLHLVPVLLGRGVRPFDDETPNLHLEQVSVVDAPGVVHLTSRRVSDT